MLILLLWTYLTIFSAASPVQWTLAILLSNPYVVNASCLYTPCLLFTIHFFLLYLPPKSVFTPIFSAASQPLPNLAQFPQPLLANNLTFPPVSPRQPITLSFPQVPTAQSLHRPVNKHDRRMATEVPSLGSAFRTLQQFVMPVTNESIFWPT